MSTPPRIAFFGLGIMGIGMARRLLKAGYAVSVYNRNQSKSAPLAAEGARVANSPADAARGADILIGMLSDDAASRAVWLGADGALASTSPGAILIEGSTLSVAWVRELNSAAEARGCRLLDAPVTGTKPHAANGELTFLVGGEPTALEIARPVLAAMSKDIIHLGPTGSGAALKLINNFFCGVQATALAEALALLDRAGLDQKTALPVLLNGAPGSPLVKTLTARHAAADYTPNFLLRLMAKDLAYAVNEGKEHNLTLATATAALATFKHAIDAGHGEEDMSAVIKYVGQSKTLTE
ncbi:MAG: NAD(P)-dependent oxidoreductase [Burkholderiales bacterium]|nr:NAD(P)-dependent oxidoreductase [Phycisphaerae bacterium]